jgi:hypothetical protein
MPEGVDHASSPWFSTPAGREISAQLATVHILARIYSGATGKNEWRESPMAKLVCAAVDGSPAREGSQIYQRVRERTTADASRVAASSGAKPDELS